MTEKLFVADSFLPFAQYFYSHLYVHHEKSNCFISPLSIYSGLSLVLTGSSGRMHHDIAHLLHVPTEHLKDYDYTLAALGRDLDGLTTHDVGKTLVLANALFLQSTYEVNRGFTDALKKHFHSHMQKVNFSSEPEASRKKINTWVANNTGMMVPELMPSGSINNATRLVLANAIYFKGTWETPFVKEMTMNMPFTTLSNREIQVPTMRDTNTYAMATFDDLSVTALRIPFKCHEMIIFLPDAKNGLLELLQKMFDPRHVARFKGLFDKSKYEESRVELFLPKFKLGGGKSVDLKAPLSDLGLGNLFDQQHAELERITEKEKLYISEMVHQAVIEVNEEGVEAAAATGISVMPMCLCPSFAVDHPFLFFIVTESGAPVFLGHVVDPLA